MKIIRFTAENVKRLKVVDITPADALVQVTGKNGSGKSSVLDSIWWALGGREGIQSVPIRKGAEKGRIQLDLGEFIVERKFTASGSTITVKTREGASYGSPQGVLDALIGELSFDPLAFSRMDSRKQFDELRRIAKLEIDVDLLDRLNKGDYTSRTEVNRDAKAKRAQAAAIVLPETLPAEPIDENDLLNQIQSAGEHNAAIESRKAGREKAQRDANDKKAEGVGLREKAANHRESGKARVEDLRRQMTELESRIASEAQNLDALASAALDEAARLETKIDGALPLPERIDVTCIRAALDSAKATNAHMALRDRYSAILAEAVKLEADSKAITERMESRDKAKADAIKAAQMPVAGLGFGEGIVTFNDLPFEQASGAEQLRVSVSIAMAANPKLRVIRIKDGSLLDDEGIRMIQELAAEKDYQVWLERVDGSGKIGVVMEDGEVAADHQQEEVTA